MQYNWCLKLYKRFVFNRLLEQDLCGILRSHDDGLMMVTAEKGLLMKLSVPQRLPLHLAQTRPNHAKPRL